MLALLIISIAAILLVITFIAGLVVLAPLEDALIYGIATAFIPAGYAVYCVLVGDYTTAGSVTFTALSIYIAIPIIAFALSSLWHPSRFLLSAATLSVTIAAYLAFGTL